MSKTSRYFEMKRRGEPIAVLTAYDAPTARAQVEADVDLILVGDSVGTNVLGYASEREVTLADIAHHLGAVRRGAPTATILADLPFGTYDTEADAVHSARRLTAAGADIVKFEGAEPHLVRALVEEGIAVSGHLGLEPQHHAEKRLKGRTAEAALKLEADALALDRAGVSLLVLELIPEEVAARITEIVDAPTIGIGAGRKTDGQVLVINDVLGVSGANFRHNRRFADWRATTQAAVSAYVRAVRQKEFPAEANAFRMSGPELALLEDESWRTGLMSASP